MGLISNNGPIDVAGANKATHFIQWMCQLGHPIIYLQNTTGYMVGKDSEQAGMIKVSKGAVSIERDGQHMAAAVGTLIAALHIGTEIFVLQHIGRLQCFKLHRAGQPFGFGAARDGGGTQGGGFDKITAPESEPG